MFADAVIIVLCLLLTASLVWIWREVVLQAADRARLRALDDALDVAAAVMPPDRYNEFASELRRRALEPSL